MTMDFDFSYRPLTYWPTLVSADGALRETSEANARVIARLSIDGYMSGSNINLAAQHVGQSVFVKNFVRFSKRLPPRFLATSDAPAAG
jgi:hypothetical protein